MDAQKRVYVKNKEFLLEDLARLHKRAAQSERRGKKVPVSILDQMAQIEKNIQAADLDIGRAVQQREGIEKKFDKEIVRFMFLTKTNKANAKTVSDKMAELKAANTLGLFNCENEKQCLLAWEEARKFVILNSTTGINFYTETLIMGNDPMQETDISLSVSKSTRKNNKVSIFLDIRCHNSSLGAELCLRKQVDLIRRSFNPYIESTLKK